MDEYLSLYKDLTAYLLDPHRKTYWLYLISSFVIGFIFLYFFYYNNQVKIKAKIWNKKHWIGKSAYCDYFLLVLNSIIRVFLIVPFFWTGISLTFKVTAWLMQLFPNYKPIDSSDSFVVFLYTFMLWLVGDFSRFHLHWLAHKISFLWELHKVHHSAEVMNPFTLFRQHPFEMFLFHIRGTIVFGLVTGIFYFIFENQLEVIEILGVNIGRFIFLCIGANLRHSHVPLFYPSWLEHLFVSPIQHQIHHSLEPSDHHKNMGSHLAIWDWIFGSLKISDKKKLEYEFGISKTKDENFNHWLKVLYVPIVKGINILRKSRSKR